MICSTCRKVESTTSVWSAGWIAANMPPLPVCNDCCKQHKQVAGCVDGKEALERFNQIKQSVIWNDPVFDQLQSEILLNGDVIKGREASKSLTLLSRLLVSYKGDYWILTKYSMLNIGADTFWCNRLEFK